MIIMVYLSFPVMNQITKRHMLTSSHDEDQTGKDRRQTESKWFRIHKNIIHLGEIEEKYF